MRITVISDYVSLIYYAFCDRGIFFHIYTKQKEGRMNSFPLQCIENLICCLPVRAIIKCEGDKFWRNNVMKPKTTCRNKNQRANQTGFKSLCFHQLLYGFMLKETQRKSSWLLTCFHPDELMRRSVRRAKEPAK